MAERRRPSLVLLLLPAIALIVLAATEWLKSNDDESDASPPTTTQSAAPEQDGVKEANQGTPGDEGAADVDSSPGSAAEPDGVLAADEARTRLENQALYTLQTERFEVAFTDLNTAIASAKIKGERYLEDGEPFELVTTNKERYYPLAPQLIGVSIPTNATWETIEQTDKAIRFRWVGDGVSVTRTWQLADAAYQLQSVIEVRNESPQTRVVGLEVTSAHYVTREEEEGGFLARPSPKLSHGICRQADETHREDREDLLIGVGGAEQARSWGPDVDFVALTNVYFAIISAPEGQQGERCELFTTDRGGTINDPEGSLFESALIYPKVEVPAGQTASFRTAVYAGPKDFDALEAFGHQATSVVDLGWFSFIARGLSWLLRKIYDFVGNWGVAIILLTLLVRVVLLPFVIPQFRNMAKQRALKPEIDRINELYKDEREKKGAAMMELWRKNKVNPLGGCLPVLLQMPIFFALYQTLATSIELYHAPFFAWWSDLSSPDPYYVLPILLGLLMFLQQKLTPVAMDPTQAKVMLYAMPLMMTVFMILLPAGLCLYMVTSSAVGISQQRYMYWKMDRESTEVVPHEPTEDADGDKIDATAKKAIAHTKRAKPRRKKRPRRGRA